MLFLKTKVRLKALSGFSKIASVKSRGVIATDKGDSCGFCFAILRTSIWNDEDPVTGSAHTTLNSYWSMCLVNRTDSIFNVQLVEENECKLKETVLISVDRENCFSLV